ncbi:MAG: NAD-dependent epimerase/dehydratase family protein [Anaerolineales bacterium]
MILVTGGPGFIGQRLIRRLVDEGKDVRVLIRPAAYSPNIPQGVSVQAAISNLNDTRGLRAALVGVDTVFHLAGVDWVDARDDLRAIEIDGTRNLLETAQDAGVKRLVYVSHLDADRASAFPVLKAKGIAEEFIRQNPIPFTIIRSGLVFGPGDHFTVPLAQLMAYTQRAFLLPSDGAVLLQPIWVEDLISCLVWSLEDEETIGQTFEIGGPEHLSLRAIIALIQEKAKLGPRFVPVRPSYLRLLVSLLHLTMPRLPLSNFWLDYFAADRLTELDNVSRIFQLMPSRISQRLEYLEGVNWESSMRERLAGRSS